MNAPALLTVETYSEFARTFLHRTAEDAPQRRTDGRAVEGIRHSLTLLHFLWWDCAPSHTALAANFLQEHLQMYQMPPHTQ